MAHLSQRSRVPFLLALLLAVSCGWALLDAADHSDAPLLVSGGLRQDANITDLHAFRSGPNLVLTLSTNPAIPPSATSYVFPSDVTFEINIDVDSAVSGADPFGDGGTVADPGRIREDVTFRIRFREDGSAKIQKVVRGALKDDPELVGFFAGLRDDPFIRIPRDGRNTGAIVLEVPLASIARSQDTLLIWATSKVQEFEGPQQEAAGRSLRSMFPEQSALNSIHPSHHLRKTGLRPDVMIFDTSRAAAFPNGRALADDVVLLACTLGGECRVFNTESRPMTPRMNDAAFLATFPYLAPPHTAP